MRHRPAAPLSLLLALACACLLASSAPSPASASTARVARLPHGLHAGIFSPNGAAAAERRAAPFRLRYVYVTSGVGDGRRHRLGAPMGRVLDDWLRESSRLGMVPVMTYYQLQPSASGGGGELARVGRVLRERATMRAYWHDVIDVLRLAGRHRRHPAVLQVEPDGWEYLHQMQGARTPAMVSATGLRVLRGLPDDARGFARAFVRLRNRYAPNVALGWHASGWGVGQVVPGSPANFAHMARLRARFLHALGGGYDLAFTDPISDAFDQRSFAEELAFIRSFHHAAHMPVMLWQIRGPQDTGWLLAGGAAGHARAVALRAAGIRGLLFDAGTPVAPTASRGEVLRLARLGYAAGRLG